MKKVYYAIFAVAILGCSSGSQVKPVIGMGGSTARFAISENKLYAVTTSALQVYDISNPANFKLSNVINFSARGIETIFCTGNNLFIGADNGMYIVDIKKFSKSGETIIPTFFPHAQARDPVVANDSIAYVTLRSSNFTGRRIRGTNELLVINVKDKNNPFLLNRIPMESPYGLGITDTFLFVCDTKLTVFSIKNPSRPREVRRYNNKFMDVIPYYNYLLAVGKDGFFQYRITEKDSLELLSKILIE